MYGQYLAAVVRRAFQPGARFTDILQILAASAAPAAAKFLGLRVPTPDETLAYIAAAAIAFVVLRLFFVAPYQVWREGLAEIGTLKLELSKPERLVVEHLAQHRAKARAELAAELEDFQVLAFAPKWNETANVLCSEKSATIRRLQAAAGLGEAFQEGRLALLHAIIKEADTPDAELPSDRPSQRLLTLLQSHLIGDLTAEALALQLLKDIESEKRQ